MKISSINTTTFGLNPKAYQSLKNEQKFDTVSITNQSKHNETTNKQKDYGDLFSQYLDNAGYFESYTDEQKAEIINDIKQNVYSFDVTKMNNVYTSYFEITDSVTYLKSIASNIESIDFRKEFTDLINTYKTNTYKAITDYTNKLLLEDDSDKECLNLLKEKMAETSMLLKQAENAREQIENTKDAFDVISNCMKIAMRILNGDDVPSKDVQYLMENDPDLYEMAISMRKVNDDPKKYKSVLEDEEDKTSKFEVSSDNLSLEEVMNNEGIKIEGGE